MANFTYESKKNLLKSKVIWKPFESAFTWRQTGIAIFFRLEMALVRMKTLLISVLQSLYKNAFSKALASKLFELQIRDWSRLKDFSKIFQSLLWKKVEINFYTCFINL